MMRMAKWFTGLAAALLVQTTAYPVLAEPAPATGKPGKGPGSALDVTTVQKAAEAKRLIKYGVTVGVAATVQFPWFGSNTLDEPVVAAMPYIVFLPAYWRNQPATNAYCAALWSGPAENAIAASKLIDEQTGDKGTNGKGADGEGIDGEGTDGEGTDGVGVKQDKSSDDVKYKGATFGCAWRRVGLYVGYPASFKATSSVPQRTAMDTAKRDVSPIVSYGFAFVPNAVVTLLTGPSVGTVARDDGTNAVVWSWTVGLGANIDLVQLIP